MQEPGVELAQGYEIGHGEKDEGGTDLGDDLACCERLFRCGDLDAGGKSPERTAGVIRKFRNPWAGFSGST